VSARRARNSPALAILLLAPFLGEALSGATPPLELLLPWNLALMVGLYGCGALICREAAHRLGLGLVGLILLGAAYGVYEEGLVDRFWYSPEFWADQGVGAYSVVGETNLLLAVLLTAFHAAVSICCSVLLVERAFPGHRDRPWVGTRALVAAALRSRRRAPRAGPAGDGSTRRRGIAGIAFAATALFWIVAYSLPEAGIPWPLGIALALAPIVAGWWLVARRASGDRFGDDALRVITAILAFFVLLDLFVGLTGRYDMILGGAATAAGLRWLWRRRPAPARTASASG